MCRNIRPLNNFEPPATDDEVSAAALQYVRKVAGTTRPSAANEAAFNEAVAEIAHTTRHLLEHLVTNAPPKDRDVEAAKRKAAAQKAAATRKRNAAAEARKREAAAAKAAASSWRTTSGAPTSGRTSRSR